MKKYLLVLVSLISLVSCAGASNVSNTEVSNELTISSNIVPEIKNLKIETSGHFSEAQLNYLTNDTPTDTSPYNGNMSVSKPLPVSISWESNVNGPFLVEIISGNAFGGNSLNEGEITTYEVNEPHFDFYNPLLNENQIVRVRIKDDPTGNSISESFIEKTVVAGPRSLYVDGVENFRDIGGWGKFVDNTYTPYIKQGLLYRSGRFNEDKVDPVNVTISEEGIKEINNRLKIKTEIDLRRTSTNEVGGLSDKSVLGDNVNYIQLPMNYSGQNILTFTGKVSGDTYEYDNPAMIKRFFEILADKNNYPINYHCSIGKDRTGCLSYLIEGLLGFDEEIMIRDYMFTNFSNAGMCKITDINNTNRYGKTLADYENGTTINEKIYNYLNLEIGLSTETLDKVINILKA